MTEELRPDESALNLGLFVNTPKSVEQLDLDVEDLGLKTSQADMQAVELSLVFYRLGILTVMVC